MGGRTGARGDGFPLLATALCLAVTLILLATSTAPALTEHRRLAAEERSLRTIRDGLLRRIAALGARGASLEHDPQAVLLAIDRLGLTPEELLARRDPLELESRSIGR